MPIHRLPITLDCCYPPEPAFNYATIKHPPTFKHKSLPLPFGSISVQPFVALSSKGDSSNQFSNGGSESELQPPPGDGDGDVDDIEVEIEILSNNRRRIRSKVAVEASLQTIWGILTDYERLADFIPGLAVSQVLDKRENFARLLQIGQQNLPFGFKFNAKGIVDCYEKDFESLPNGQKRDIEFKMIEGDFVLFEGKWSIEQSGSFVGQTTLLYAVDVEPKMWLPVQLVEGRLRKEIRTNLFCIREVAQKKISCD